MTLRRKLTLTFDTVLVLVVIQAAAAILTLSWVTEHSALLVRPALDRVDLLAHSESDVLRLRTLEYSAVTPVRYGERRRLETEMDALAADIRRRLDSYGALELDQERVAARSDVVQRYDEYIASQQAVVGAAARGDTATALAEYVQFQPQFQALDEALHALRHKEYAATEALRDQIGHVADTARWPLIVVVVLIAVSENWLARHLLTRISHGLRVLEEGAGRIGRENFDEPVPAPPERELGVLADALNRVMAALAANRTERARLARERLSQVVRAQEEERARIARELHDQAAQSLTALHYGLSRVKRLSPDPEAAAEVDRLVALATETGRQLSGLAHDLRPAVLDDLGLLPALRSYVREFSGRIGIPVELSIRGSIPRLDPDAETAVFRIVQEGLTNVAKHARAQHAGVRIEGDDGQLRLEIWDDGRGFNPEAVAPTGAQGGERRPGLGLGGIQERAQLLGGRVHIASTDGQGTRLLVTFSTNANGRGAPAPAKLAAAAW